MTHTHPEIVILSRTEASHHLLSTHTGPLVRYAISIGDPSEMPPAGLLDVPRRIRLVFHDVDHDTPLELAPTEGDVRRIVNFARGISGADGQLLVHCSAGVSRSTAAAVIVLAVWLSPGGERDAVQEVFRIAPHAMPNRRMVGFADEILERKGALLRALTELQPW